MSQSVDNSVDPLDRTVDLDSTVEISALISAGEPTDGYTVPAPEEDVEEAPRKRLKSAIFWSYALTAGRLGTTVIVTFVLARCWARMRSVS